MRSWFIFWAVSVGFYPCYEPTDIAPASGLPVVYKPVADTIHFIQHIQPILVKHCSPCHFTGGKMYERLPFDKAETILKPEVKAGLLKRLRDEKENELIRRFIEK